MKLEIRMVDIDYVGVLRAYLRRRVRLALGRFGPSARRVRVRVASGTPEGLGAEVQITLTLLTGGRIGVTEHAADPHAAVDAAVDRFARTVRRRMERIGSISPAHAIPKASA